MGTKNKLETVRNLSQEAFESIFMNDFGFRGARLQLGPGEVWGVDNRETFVTQITIDLEAVEDSYSPVDKEYGGPYFNISHDFGDMLSALFGIFFDQENFDEFSEVSELVSEKYPEEWAGSGVIIMDLHYNEEGVEKTFSIMEDSRDWEKEKNFVITNSWQYINYCHERFERFREHA